VATPLLGKFLGIMSGLSLGTRLSSLKSVALTVLELLAFNSHDRPLRTQTNTLTNTHTHVERTHYLLHSLRSLGGDNYHALSFELVYKILSYKVVWQTFCNLPVNRMRLVFVRCASALATTTEVPTTTRTTSTYSTLTRSGKTGLS